MKTLANSSNCSGHTLVEVMISAALSSLVIIGALSGFSYAGKITRSGAYQVQFTAKARASAQQIQRYIEGGKAIGVVSNQITIVTPDLRRARIYYVAATRELMYQRDVSAASTPQLLCSHVTPVGSEEMFSIIPSSPSAARIVFHVGDGPEVANAEEYSSTGFGYQGQEIRISATPRNLQRWYD